MHRPYLRLVLLAGLGSTLLCGCGRKEEAPVAPSTPPVAPPAPPVVLVATAVAQSGPLFGEMIATLDGSINTPIHAQVSGYLIKQDYMEGAAVKAGDTLFEIDPQPAPANGDGAKTSPPTARSSLDAIKITAPVDGIAGKALPGLGDLVPAGGLMTTISAVDPIKAAFTVTEQFYHDHAVQIGKLSATPVERRVAGFELLLDSAPYPHHGTFDHIDRPTQASAGSVTIYALFPNPEKRLKPGQYAKIRGVAENNDNAVVIPQRAVSEFQGSDQVAVIKPDNTVEIRTVTTGDRIGSLQIVIIGGLNPGERVVVEGFQKCQPGATVTPLPYVPPKAENPKSPSAPLPPTN